jgi:hypothetical protein
MPEKYTPSAGRAQRQPEPTHAMHVRFLDPHDSSPR